MYPKRRAYLVVSRRTIAGVKNPMMKYKPYARESETIPSVALRLLWRFCIPMKDENTSMNEMLVA